MLTSIALLWLLGMALGAAARKLHLPALVGMLLAGILLGPFGADLLSPALLSVSAACEVLGMVLLAPRLLGVSVLDAAILGAVVGAVSPAVIVPRMLDLMEAGYGTEQGIPQMVLAGASVDDVFVVVLFSSFMSISSPCRS